jgi:3-methyladenine DNA glycosylase AlkD
MEHLEELRKELSVLKNPKKAKILQGFFKTALGQYGEGDIFLGITVPESRKLAIRYSSLPFGDIQALLESNIHESRLIALLILVHNYNKHPEKSSEIYGFYLKNTKHINNWDLVDLSAPKIIGSYLFDKDRAILYKLAKSSDLWEKRISIISTFYFISKHQFQDSLNIAELLLKDKHDLIHKAVGWMLREIGKRSQSAEEQFLKKHYKVMPRTMLRYAIEKFPDSLRKAYLNGKV